MIMVSAALNYLSRHPPLKPFAARLANAKFIKRPWFLGKPTFAFTLSNTVMVPRDWNNILMDGQAALLSHEAVHLFQWDRLGPFVMSTTWLQKAGRLRLEQEAYANMLKFWVWEGLIPNIVNSLQATNILRNNHIINETISLLMEDYALGAKAEFNALFDWAVRIVERAWKEKLTYRS